jgi:hypothetical protein
MGNNSSIQKINYEDMEHIIKNKQQYILINTLPSFMQDCLIINTIPCNEEEAVINHMLKNYIQKTMIVYGKNNHDEKTFDKYEQLVKLGFQNVYIYVGGLFEWVLLQDIYGDDLFPTTKKELDILKFRPKSSLNRLYLTQS